MVKKEFLFQTNFTSQTELFHEVTRFLKKGGYVTKEFEAALAKREQEFPTGLPTEPAVAIPHTDGTYVKKDTIVCVLNTKSIAFNEMGANESDFVYPKIFFVIVLGDGETHMQQLQNLIEKIQDGKLAEKILASKHEEEFQEIINQYL